LILNIGGNMDRNEVCMREFSSLRIAVEFAALVGGTIDSDGGAL